MLLGIWCFFFFHYIYFLFLLPTQPPLGSQLLMTGLRVNPQLPEFKSLPLVMSSKLTGMVLWYYAIIWPKAVVSVFKRLYLYTGPGISLWPVTPVCPSWLCKGKQQLYFGSLTFIRAPSVFVVFSWWFSSSDQLIMRTSAFGKKRKSNCGFREKLQIWLGCNLNAQQLVSEESQKPDARISPLSV